MRSGITCPITSSATTHAARLAPACPVQHPCGESGGAAKAGSGGSGAKYRARARGWRWPSRRWRFAMPERGPPCSGIEDVDSLADTSVSACSARGEARGMGMSSPQRDTSPLVPLKMPGAGGDHPGVTFSSAMSFLQVRAFGLLHRSPASCWRDVDSNTMRSAFVPTAYGTATT